MMTDPVVAHTSAYTRKLRRNAMITPNRAWVVS